MAPTVVVDTTELFKHPFLRTGGWKELLARSRRGQITIVVPEVALREAARHFVRNVDKTMRPALDVLDGLRDLGVAALPDIRESISGIDDVGGLYLKHIRSRMNEYGAQEGRLPNVSHDELLTRDLEERKPFNPSGRGYRDALIWETVLEQVRSNWDGDPVYFLTANTSDFCDKDGQLAAGLASEVSVHGYPGQVKRLAGAAELRAELEEYFEMEDTGVFDDIYEPSLTDIVREALVSRTEQLVGHISLRSGHEGRQQPGPYLCLPVELNNPELDAIVPEPDTADYFVYDQYEGDTLSVSASIEAEYTVTGHIDADQWDNVRYLVDRAEVLEDDRDDWYSDEDEPDDDDERPHRLWIELSERQRVKFDLLVIGGEVEDMTIDSIERL